MPVVGIGGVFFRARDPDALNVWYRTHFRVTTENYEPWIQAAGPTVFMPFAQDTDHFPHDKQWMINFRVAELDGLLAALRADGLEVTTNPDWDAPETGRFARLYDPEGNAIELWEPPLE
jgi:predicted enzyme related to lactoylglutathione lyase